MSSLCSLTRFNRVNDAVCSLHWSYQTRWFIFPLSTSVAWRLWYLTGLIPLNIWASAEMLFLAARHACQCTYSMWLKWSIFIAEPCPYLCKAGGQHAVRVRRWPYHHHGPARLTDPGGRHLKRKSASCSMSRREFFPCSASLFGIVNPCVSADKH